MTPKHYHAVPRYVCSVEYVFLQIATEKSDLEKLIPLLTHANSTIIVPNNKAPSVLYCTHCSSSP